MAQALDRQIKRFKSQNYRSERSRLAGRSDVEEPDEAYSGARKPGEESAGGANVPSGAFASGQVVRLKEFDMEPTSVEEAAAQMQYLGHDFYMFLDSESDKHSVLYLRGDGNYGLIQPK